MLKCHFFKKVILWPPHLPDETEQPCDMWPLFTVLIWSDALQCPPPHRQLPEGKTGRPSAWYPTGISMGLQNMQIQHDLSYLELRAGKCGVA